jgi:phytoene synthase
LVTASPSRHADIVCRAITRRHATTFSLAARLLPAERRRDVHALYALARTADDLVDVPAPGTDPAIELERLEARLSAIIASDGVGPTGPDDEVDLVLVAAAATVLRHGIPQDCLARFFASMRLDLTVTRYDTWDDLVGYMDGSGSAIGEMLLPLLDPVDRAAALGPARSLGLAFQFTNFLRDIAEDLDRGRQYLPHDDLRRFGVDLTDRRVDGAFRALMEFEIARCRRLYADADPGLALLSPRSRPAIAAAHAMYEAILDRIEAVGFDVFSGRVRVRRTRRLLIVAGALAGRGRR